MAKTIAAKPLTFGQGSGEVLRLEEPVSFWGGVDYLGIISDRLHPQYGQSVTGKILAMTTSRGSSSGSFCLMELMRTKLAPAAIILTQADGVTATGVLVGTETYGIELPVIQVTTGELLSLESGTQATVTSSPDGAQLTLN